MFKSVDELEDRLSEPTSGVIQTLKKAVGDVLVLGAGGKMGPTLARMARRGADAADGKRGARRVIAASRFSNKREQAGLEACGVETVAGNLLDEDTLARLPDAANIIYMAGMKFGAADNEPLTWAMNTHLPALVCRRYAHRRIVAFSTGNVYGLTPVAGVAGGGSVESDAPEPVGEYAMSCLGRERIFEYFSATHGTPVCLLRLNYAVEMRYGVLVDLARKVWQGDAVDVTMGQANVIWQGDANAMALQSLACASSPATVLNIAGPQRLVVRRVCEQFGAMMGRQVNLTGSESHDALLSDAGRAFGLFGRPKVGLDQLIAWTAAWVMGGGKSLSKPTHFEVRDGKF